MLGLRTIFACHHITYSSINATAPICFTDLLDTIPDVHYYGLVLILIQWHRHTGPFESGRLLLMGTPFFSRFRDMFGATGVTTGRFASCRHFYIYTDFRTHIRSFIVCKNSVLKVFKETSDQNLSP